VTLEAALSIAHVFLNRRERTEHEVREHLLRRHAEPDTTEAVLRELTAQGYLDDGRFARLFIQDKRDLSRWGRGRIQRALIQRGVARDIAELALDRELASEEDELQRAVEVLDDRFPIPVLTGRERERALGFLLRRGYEYELAAQAITVHGRAA
jgi:regulatory protein